MAAEDVRPRAQTVDVVNSHVHAALTSAPRSASHRKSILVFRLWGKVWGEENAIGVNVREDTSDKLQLAPRDALKAQAMSIDLLKNRTVGVGLTSASWRVAHLDGEEETVDRLNRRQTLQLLTDDSNVVHKDRGIWRRLDERPDKKVGWRVEGWREEERKETGREGDEYQLN